MKIILKLAANVIALYLVAYLVPGVKFDSFSTLLIASLVIGLINTFIKPLVKLLTLPINMMTLGLFTLVINIALLLLAALIVPGFELGGFFSAIVASLLLTLVSWVLNKFID